MVGELPTSAFPQSIQLGRGVLELAVLPPAARLTCPRASFCAIPPTAPRAPIRATPVAVAPSLRLLTAFLSLATSPLRRGCCGLVHNCNGSAVQRSENQALGPERRLVPLK